MNDVTHRILADALLVAAGVGILALYLLAFDAALFLIRTRRNRR